jgi:hypothetical protein
MSKFTPPQSPEAAIAELETQARLDSAEFKAEELDRIAEQNANEIAASLQPEPVEFISIGELLLLNVETRIGRIADALETANKIDRNNFEALTAGVNRLADAFEMMAGFIGCVTDSVQSDADGVTRCYVRTRDENHGWLLSSRDDRDGD